MFEVVYFEIRVMIVLLRLANKSRELRISKALNAKKLDLQLDIDWFSSCFSATKLFCNTFCFLNRFDIFFLRAVIKVRKMVHDQVITSALKRKC